MLARDSQRGGPGTVQNSLTQRAVNRVTAAALERSRARTKDNYWVCPSEEADAREEVSVRWRGQKSGWELERAMITQGQDPSSRERETGDSIRGCGF